MEEKITAKIDDQEKITDEVMAAMGKAALEWARQDLFNKKSDIAAGRLSYDLEFGTHFSEELHFIAGVLDMVVVLGSNDHMDELSDESVFVIIDARNRAMALTDSL